MGKQFLSCMAVSILGLALTETRAHAAGIKPPFSNDVTITIENGVRTIKSNGIPNHETGQFPGRGNPNAISQQQYEFHMTADPKPAGRLTPLRMQPFGI